MNAKKIIYSVKRNFLLAAFVLLVAPLIFSCDEISDIWKNEKKQTVDTTSLKQYFHNRYGPYVPQGSGFRVVAGEPSEISGFREGFYEIVHPERMPQKLPFLVSDDGKWLVITAGAELVKVDDMEEIGSTGARKGSLSAQGQGLSIVVSPDRKKIVPGEVIDLSENPMAETAALISLDGVPWKGSPDAVVNVVEYSDFQCSYCAAAASELSELLSDYKGKIKVFYKQFPIASIHPWAHEAAAASLCVYDQSNEKFWLFHDAVFERQSEIGVDGATEIFREIAGKIGVDLEKYDECAGSEEAAKRVTSDMEEGLSIGVRATPTFVVNGAMISGARMDAIRTAVEYNLSKVQAEDKK